MSTTNSAGWDAGTGMHPAIGDEPEHDPFALDDDLAHIDRGGDVAGWTPAFPTDVGPNGDGFQTGNTQWHSPGMTLRDYFAAKALPDFLDLEVTSVWNEARGLQGNRDIAAEVARAAYFMADAMLKARVA